MEKTPGGLIGDGQEVNRGVSYIGNYYRRCHERQFQIVDIVP